MIKKASHQINKSIGRSFGRLKHVRTFIGFVGLSVVFLLLECSLPQKIEASIGEGVDVVEGQPLNIRAESLEYLADRNLFVAEGFVEITYRNSYLTADRVEFNEITGDAIATGNVVYEEEGETVIADKAELNFDSELGIIYVGELTLKEDHYITGQKIEKIGEETYLIRKGSYTACCGSWPAWQFRSSRAKVHQGEYMQSWNTVGYVKGIPVFYFPYFIFPIKTERQSGFLVPDIGRSTANGFTLTNAYFWAISKSQDTTVSHTYYEERGHKVVLEYRYKYSAQTDGTLEGQYIRDKIDLSQKRRLTWNHQHGLPYSIKARINLNLTSDDQFDKDFETKLEDRTRQKLDSDISLTKNFSQHSFLLSVRRSDDLREESEDRADQRFPELHITSQKQQLFGTLLYIQQKTQIARLKREGKKEENLDFIRIDIQPTLTYPLNLLGQALTISPEIRLRETYYTRDATTAADPDLEAKSAHREYYKIGVGVNGPKFNRIFDLGTSRRTQKLKHLIEPYLSFYYVPGIDEGDLPKFDSIDRVGSEYKSRNMSYGITQRLLAKKVKEGDWKKFLDEDEDVFIDELSTEIKELASLAISQYYDFEEEEYPFSNIGATLKMRPFNNYDFTLRTSYDVYVNEFVQTNIDLNGTLWSFLSFGLRWRRDITVDRKTDDITDVNQFLDVSTQFNLLENKIGISYRGRFNVEDKERIEDSIGLTYNAQCWNVIGSYTQQKVGSDDVDKRYKIMLELKHLGKLFDIQG